MDFDENDTADLKNKILAVLDELLFRKVISKQEHKDILKDMNQMFILLRTLLHGIKYVC